MSKFFAALLIMLERATR